MDWASAFANLDQACISTFSESVTYRRGPARAQSGPPQPITAGSPDPAVEQQYDLTVIWREDEAAHGRQGIQATAWCPLSEFSTGFPDGFVPLKNDRITRGDRTYVVVDDPRDSTDRVTNSVTLYLRFLA